MQFLQKLCRFHRDGDSGAVVDRAGAQVPGIEVSGDDDELLGMLAALQIGDHVVAGGIGQFLRSEGEVHAHLSLRGEMRDQVGIFGSDGTGGNSGGNAEASVRQAEVGATHGAHEGSHGAQVGCGLGSGRTVAHAFAIGHEGHPSFGLALVENFVEEDDLAGDLVAAQSFQFVKIVDHDNIGRESFDRR